MENTRRNRRIATAVSWLFVFIFVTLSGIYHSEESSTWMWFIWLALSSRAIGYALVRWSKNYVPSLIEMDSGPPVTVRLSPIMGEYSKRPLYAKPIGSGQLTTAVLSVDPVYQVFSLADQQNTDVKRSMLMEYIVTERPNSSTFTLEYLVMVADLGKTVPHIFVDGLSQNVFNMRHQNLWSLSKMLSKRDKLQDLEGDFSKYFSVYATERDSVPLTVLAPDVMMKLRERGIYLDYELYGNSLYIYSEPRLNSQAEVTEYLETTQQIIAEIRQQVRNQQFTLNSKMLGLRTVNLRLWALLYAMIIATRIVLIVLLLMTYETIIYMFRQGTL